jgi:hypothetical protein
MYFVHEVIIAFSADAIHVWTWLGAFALISSAVPRGSDLLGDAAEGPFLTQPGSSSSPARFLLRSS